jgi:Pyruvate/2-oxoacid:ferredoxin oxidoreductase gamma subunit
MERAVVMTGIGGQGIQLLAKLLAQAAIREGREVMTFGVFGGMIRGGSSESTVVVADRAILTPPIVPRAWAVLAMHPAGLPALARKAEAGGLLLYNATLVATPPPWDGVRTLGVPATETAKAMGEPLGASMIALGALVRATGLVGAASLRDALGEVLPPHRRRQIDANGACLARGAELVGDGPRAWT